MPPFRRKTTPEAQPPETSLAAEPAPPSARQRYDELVAEQQQIQTALDAHQEQRTELLRDGKLSEIRALQNEDETLRLKLEQLELRVPGLAEEIQQEWRASVEQAWEAHRPGLAAAEMELAQAIRTFHAALDDCHRAHAQAYGFGERLRQYVRPPPAESYNRWALLEYSKAVELRRNPAAVMPEPYAPILEPPLTLPQEQRFVPHRLSHAEIAEIQAISALEPARFVQILHGPCRVASLNVGLSRVFEGEEHYLPARGAAALVMAGIARYIDLEDPAAVTAETSTEAA